MQSNHVIKNIVIALSLIGAGFLVAWLRFRPHLETQGSFTDGERTYQQLADEPLRYALWDRAAPLAGLKDEATSHADPALSPDGRWIVFAAGERGLNVDLWLAPMYGEEPGPARPLHELNSDEDDVTPAFLGNTLYFASNRPGGAGGMDLWQATFLDGEFTGVTRLPDSLNTKADETDPAPEGRGGWLAFASNREHEGERDYDLYWASLDGAHAFQPEALSELNSPAHERDPAFTADGHTLFFASDRGEGRTFGLYRSVYDRNEWLAAKAVQGLGSEGHHRGPQPSPDGFRLLYSLQGEAAPGEVPGPSGVYAAPTRELFLRPSQPVGWFEILLLLALLLLALLAWLAKRWTTVEVIYRCFLVSLLVHALLMLWFQDVHPEQEPVELAERSPTYQVRLAMDSPRQRAQNAERGGQLETNRSESEPTEEASPQRAEQAATSATESFEAPTPASRALALQAAPQSAPSPSEAAESALRPAAHAASESSVALEDQATAEPLYDGAAPTLAMEATALESQPSPRNPGGAANANPQRVEVSGSPLGAPEQPSVQVSPLAARVGRETPALGEQGTPLPTPAAQPSAALATELRGPSETFETQAQASPSLAAPKASQAFEPSRSGERSLASGLQRSQAAEGSSRELPSASPSVATPSAALSSNAPNLPAMEAAAQESPAPSTSVPEVALQGPIEAWPETESDNPAESPAQPLASAAPSRSFERSRRGPERALRRFDTDRPLDRAQPAARPAPELVIPEVASTPVTPERQEVPFARTPYRNRFGLAKEKALEELGGSAETEAAVASGLKYLASIQHQNGYWGRRSKNYDKYRQLRIGKTGLSVLAFLGAGHTHQSEGEYQEVVAQGLRYLLGKQDRGTGHFGDCSAYGHAIATYAIAECYALTQDEDLREPIERAVAQILRNQHTRRDDPRFYGGWNYYYPDNEQYDSWPRVSVTSWQVMALESARLGGLRVPQESLDNARTFLLNAWDGEMQAFRYNHSPSRLRDRYPTLPASTPAALFALSLLGEDLSSGTFGPARAFLTERIPDVYEFQGERAFVFEGSANLYFWYYSSLALLRAGGKDWERWNTGLKKTLLPAQQEDGSWIPISIYAEYAADSNIDRSYTTAMCVLSLEVYYRYFTPLLQER